MLIASAFGESPAKKENINSNDITLKIKSTTLFLMGSAYY